MPKQQRIPDIPEDINLFEIPRKKPPAEVPPPPAPAPAPAQTRGPGRGGPAAHNAHNNESAAPHTNQQAKYWEQKVREHAAENLKLHQQLESITKHRDQLLTVLSTQQQGGAALE